LVEIDETNHLSLVSAIGKKLLNTNENATVRVLQKFLELNKAFLHHCKNQPQFAQSAGGPAQHATPGGRLLAPAASSLWGRRRLRPAALPA
jgi:hypothetical protein